MSDKASHLSATSISTFKRCPEQYRLSYVEGIREAVEPGTFRMGHAWHTGLEVLAKGDDLEAAVLAATQVYETVPDSADATEWAVERETIAILLAGYHWLYSQATDQYEIVATELPFELPLVNPETGRPTQNMVRVGKIDRIMRNKTTGAILIGENKTTSRPIDTGSSYWARLRMDTQSRHYICAARDLQLTGGLDVLPIALKDGDTVHKIISGLLHDVVHKPQIKPSKLTMAESKTFIDTGLYCGQQFLVANLNVHQYTVDGVLAEIEPGKKEGTFALRETPGMFGARLLQDIAQRPEYYYARREIAFTDAELDDYRQQMWFIQKNMNEMERTGRWIENESACEPVGGAKCRYCVICYNNVRVDADSPVPPGFVRLARIEALRREIGVTE